MTIYRLVSGLLAALAVPFAIGWAGADTLYLAAGHWVDLSHRFDSDTLYWPTARRFEKTEVFEGHTKAGFYYTAYDFAGAEHGGTHLDAPIHFAEGRQAVDDIPLKRLIAPAVVVDITTQVLNNRDYQLGADDLSRWEELNGPVPAGAIVLVRTGFAAHWPNAEAYLGTAKRGAEAVADLHFPGIGPAAARLLVERNIAAVGIDTASVDHGQSKRFLAHQVLYEANIPGFENVADLSGMPTTGVFVVALPMKIRGGSGAPLRIVAFVPDTGQ